MHGLVKWAFFPSGMNLIHGDAKKKTRAMPAFSLLYGGVEHIGGVPAEQLRCGGQPPLRQRRQTDGAGGMALQIAQLDALVVVVPQQHPGQDGHAPFLSHQCQGRVVAVDAGAVCYGTSGTAENVSHVVVDALGGDDDPFLPQTRQRHLRQFAQRMAAGQHQQHIILHQRRQAEGLAGGGGEEAHIHFLFQDPLLHGLVITVLKPDLYGGITRGHALDQRREPADSDTADAPYRYHARYAAAEVCRLCSSCSCAASMVST